MNKAKTGDLVYIIDPNNHEPIMMGVGLVVGETKSYGDYGTMSPSASTPVLWNGKVEYLSAWDWMLEVINESP